MKFLHTSDWHLGVKTNGIDRIEEQKKVLEEILSITNFENIDCVIIAGDIFNVSNPSAEAEEVFFDTIEKLSAKGDRFILVLAGNHDDPTRIEAGLPLASKHNIALVGDLTELKTESFNHDALVKVVESGKGYIKIQKGDEIATIAYLPYPSESRISEKIDDQLSYAEKVKNWSSIGAGAFSKESFNIFVSHLFMVGSKTRNSEVKVGDILAVPQNYLPNADYTALGHIHTPQTLGENIYYSGAITALSVGQKDLGVNILETEDNKLVSVTNVKLKNLVKYEKVEADSIYDAEQKLASFDDMDIVELSITAKDLISSSELKDLKKKFACISNIALVRPMTENKKLEKQDKKLLSDEDLFKDFYLNVRGFEANDDLLKMFNLCIGEENETD